MRQVRAQPFCFGPYRPESPCRSFSCSEPFSDSRVSPRSPPPNPQPRRAQSSLGRWMQALRAAAGRAEWGQRRRGKTQKSAESESVGGTAGIETEAAAQWGHTVGGGIAREGNGNGPKDRRKTRTQRDLHREQSTWWSGPKHGTQTLVSTELIGYGMLRRDVLICGPMTSFI